MEKNFVGLPLLLGEDDDGLVTNLGILDILEVGLGMENKFELPPPPPPLPPLLCFSGEPFSGALHGRFSGLLST